MRGVRMRLSPRRGSSNGSERSRFVLVSVLDGLSPYSCVVVVAVHGIVMKSCVACACACHCTVNQPGSGSFVFHSLIRLGWSRPVLEQHHRGRPWSGDEVVRGVRTGLSPLRGPINDSESSRFVLVSVLDGLSPYSRVIIVTVHGAVMRSCVECARVRHRFVDRSTTASVHVSLSVGVSVLDKLSSSSSLVVIAVHEEVKRSCAECAWACHCFVDRPTTASVHVPVSIDVSVLDGLSPSSGIIVSAVHGEVKMSCVACAWNCHRFVPARLFIIVSPRHRASSSWPSMER